MVKTVLSQGDLLMPEYLSKEEIRKWRSSLERITLEEYAARLGKVIQGEKQTNDIVDKVMTRSLNNFEPETYNTHAEKIQTIAMKSFEREKELHNSKQTQKKVQPQKNITIQKELSKKDIEIKITETKNETKDNFKYSFKKNLTSREQVIFDYFLENKNSIVYAKDLAKLLDLPRDYVYKYIKNLRTKINEDVLYNADNGGYVLKA